MKRMLLVLPLALPLALSATIINAGPAMADERTCRGTIGAVSIDGDVNVPRGATCKLLGTRIDGSVFVRGNAVLVAKGVTVGGSIQADDHRRVLVTVRKVGDRVVPSRVGSDIQLEGGDRGKVVRAVIGGSLQAVQNKELQVMNNNVINSDLQAFSNKGGVRIFGNRIDGNLQCKSNDPRPVGDNNRVSGNKEDQCRAF